MEYIQMRTDDHLDQREHGSILSGAHTRMSLSTRSVHSSILASEIE